jgi:hypothetical protein
MHNNVDIFSGKDLTKISLEHLILNKTYTDLTSDQISVLKLQKPDPAFLSKIYGSIDESISRAPWYISSLPSYAACKKQVVKFYLTEKMHPDKIHSLYNVHLCVHKFIPVEPSYIDTMLTFFLECLSPKYPDPS